LAPSWFTADPRITARTRSPEASASPRRFKTKTPQPSPRTNPSAKPENGLQREANIPAWEKVCDASVDRIRLTPPARPRSQFPRESASQERWTETKEEEQAVSIARRGPRNPRR